MGLASLLTLTRVNPKIVVCVFRSLSYQIALGADMRISTPKCKFSIMEAKWGLIPDMVQRKHALPIISSATRPPDPCPVVLFQSLAQPRPSLAPRRPPDPTPLVLPLSGRDGGAAGARVNPNPRPNTKG